MKLITKALIAFMALSTIGLFVYLKLSRLETDKGHMVGRIANIKESKWPNEGHQLILYLSGRSLNISIRNPNTLKELKEYNGHFVKVNYVQYLTSGPYESEFEVVSWAPVFSGKSLSDMANAVKLLDHHLLCAWFSEVSSEKDLHDHVMTHLSVTSPTTIRALKNCE